jgi:hypothetical protein
LREASRILDIQLLDHVICGEAKADPAGRGFYSFWEAGLLRGSSIKSGAFGALVERPRRFTIQS